METAEALPRPFFLARSGGGPAAIQHMFSTNPFALLADAFDPLVMQVYAALMIAAVLGGTIFDAFHKRSAEYFSQRRARAAERAERQLSFGKRAGLALATLGKEVLTAGEFCKWRRQVSHLLMAYGFVAYLIATVVLLFCYPTVLHPPVALTAAWTIGAIMVLIGGSWFFFILRVDVAFEKRSPFALVQADLFIGSLLMSVTFGLAWHAAQTFGAGGTAVWILFALYIGFSTLLFVSVPWSKFAHMFYKPVVAFQRRVEDASGASDLPAPAQVNNIKR